jgi:hypothetical protein
MRPYPSPLEHLAAFSIVFATAFLSAVSLAAYLERVRRNAIRDHCKQCQHGLNSYLRSTTETETIE